MPTPTKPFRYQLPRKAIKGDCPECGPRHRRTLSRYVDTQTGETLPDSFGRCDRESNCGYHVSPYHKGASGLSYAEENSPRNQVAPIPKAWFRMAGKWKRNGAARQSIVSGFQDALIGATPEQAERIAAFIFDKPSISSSVVLIPNPIHSIPDEVFQQSIGHYERNQFAILLGRHVGQEAALRLLKLFQIGTSSRWPGACVFWYIDQQGRVRGGQIKLFDETFHTVKYQDAQGQTRSKTSWVHSAYARRCDEQQQPYPDWLTAYVDERNAVEKSPCLFGLPQLLTAPIDQPVAIVESPKTAVICTHFFPDFVWMAAGGKSYLNAERLAPLKGRKIALFPDLNAYHDLVNGKGQVNKGWLNRANELQAQGFDLTVSDYLEQQATDEQRDKGLDLADFLLESASQRVGVYVTAEASVSDERIQTALPVQQPEPPRLVVTQPAVKIPRLIRQYWTLWPRPPHYWNKIAAHKALLRCLESEEEAAPEIVTTLADCVTNPGAILQSLESQLERLSVEPCESYPAEWDNPEPKPFTPLATRTTHPKAPFAFDAAEQLLRIHRCVIPPGVKEADYSPTLIPSPNRDAFAQLLGVASEELPLYRLVPT